MALDESRAQMRRATTHTDLELRARQAGIPVRVIHNASIMNAVGVCGLQLYRFGEVLHQFDKRAAQMQYTHRTLRPAGIAWCELPFAPCMLAYCVSSSARCMT